MNNQEIKLKALFIRLCIKLELAYIRKDTQEIDDLLDVLTIIHKYMGKIKMIKNIEQIKKLTFEKSRLENGILKAHRLKNHHMVRELTFDLMLVENKIKELEK